MKKKTLQYIIMVTILFTAQPLITDSLYGNNGLIQSSFYENNFITR